MNNIVLKAKELDQLGNDLPDVEVGGDNSLRDLGRYWRRARGIIQYPTY